MKAIVLAETGGPERLELRDVPELTLGDGQVLVRVRAAGVNDLDVLIRRGRYPQAPPLPTIPGVEVAGEADVVVDPVGGEVFAASVGILRPLATIVAVGYTAGWWLELNPALLVLGP